MEDIKIILKEYNEDVKRHIDALKEDFEDNLKLLAESVLGIQQQLVAIRDMVVKNTEDIEMIKAMVVKNTEDIGIIKTTVAKNTEDIQIIKTDTQFIKNDLKQKVGQEEFETLERRVAVLEAKIRQN